jgi:hypothetical protein
MNVELAKDVFCYCGEDDTWYRDNILWSSTIAQLHREESLQQGNDLL